MNGITALTIFQGMFAVACLISAVVMAYRWTRR